MGGLHKAPSQGSISLIVLPRHLNRPLHAPSINIVIGKINHKIHILCKIRPYINHQTAIIIYKSHLMSLIEYGSTFMTVLPSYLKKKIQRYQNKCLRICTNSYPLDYTEKLSNFELRCLCRVLPLEYRHNIAICVHICLIGYVLPLKF